MQFCILLLCYQPYLDALVLVFTMSGKGQCGKNTHWLSICEDKNEHSKKGNEDQDPTDNIESRKDRLKYGTFKNYNSYKLVML